MLRIGLKDFGNRDDYPGIEDISGEITISFSQLYNIVQKSDTIAQRVKEGKRKSKLPSAAQKMPPLFRCSCFK